MDLPQSAYLVTDIVIFDTAVTILVNINNM